MAGKFRLVIFVSKVQLFYIQVTEQTRRGRGERRGVPLPPLWLAVLADGHLDRGPHWFLGGRSTMYFSRILCCTRIYNSYMQGERMVFTWIKPQLNLQFRMHCILLMHVYMYAWERILFPAYFYQREGMCLLEYQAMMTSLCDVAHHGLLCTFTM